MSQKLSNEEARALLNNKAKNKPVKQSQGSQAGKAPPIEQVRTTSLKHTLNGYSQVKQDVLNQIEKLYAIANEQLNLIPKERYNIDSPEIHTFLRRCRITEDFFKEHIKL